MARSQRWWLKRLAAPVRPIRRRSRLDLVQLETRDVPTGTWQALTNPSPNQPGAGSQPGVGTMLLLTNGQVIAQGAEDNFSTSPRWYLLSPDATGNYHDGTWIQTGSMALARLFYSSNVLPNGNIFQVGGEYTPSGQTYTNRGETYDPVTSTWSPIADYPQVPTITQFLEPPTALLPGDAAHPLGWILTGQGDNGNSWLYDVGANTWTQTGSRLPVNRSSPAGPNNPPVPSREENWVLLPDNSVLAYEVATGYFQEVFGAQRYIPAGNLLPDGQTLSTGQWVDASHLDPSNPPNILTYTASSGTIFYGDFGPAVRLTDGLIFLAGSNGHTAFYDPSGVFSNGSVQSLGTWSRGPDLPTVNGVQLLAISTPGSVLPNGKVLLALSPQGVNTPTGAPTYLYIFDPTVDWTVNDPFTRLDNAQGFPPDLFDALQNLDAATTKMLVVPNGHVLFSMLNSTTVWEYDPYPPKDEDPTDAPLAAGKPHALSLESNTNADGSYRLHGKLLTGISEGAVVGDDAEMSTNYPIVKLTLVSAPGYPNPIPPPAPVWYAKSFHWTPGVADDTDKTVDFTLPYNLPAGTYAITVVANGNESTESISFTWAGPRYADSRWLGLPNGYHVTDDADPVAPGVQDGFIGQNCFANVNDAISSAAALQSSTGATFAVIVNGKDGPTNSGDFSESVTMVSVVPVYLQHGDVEFGSLAGASTAAQLFLGGDLLEVGDDDTNTTYAGKFLRNGNLEKVGAGIWTLSGDNSGTFFGDVVVTGGVVQLAHPNALSNSTVTVNALLGLDATSIVSAATLGNLAGSGTINLGSTTLTVGGNNAGTGTNPVTYSGNLTGTLAGSITKVGTGFWKVSGHNSAYAGGVTIDSGTVRVGSVDALRGSTVTVNPFFLGLDLSEVTATTFGGLQGAGNIILGDANFTTACALTVGANDSSTTYDGAFTGLGSLIKTGAGTLSLTADNSTPAGTTVSAGKLLVGNHLAANAGVTVAAGATLGGSSVATVDTMNTAVSVDGRLRAGGDSGPGHLLVNGNVSISMIGTLAVRVNGSSIPGVDYDLLSVFGTVTLGRAKLALSNTNWVPAGNNTEIVIINNLGSNQVNGTFVGLPEGATVYAGGQPYVISYVGGDGNDVTLTAAPVHVVSIQVNDGSAQRSEVRSLTVTFAQHVTFAGGDTNAAAAFALKRVSDNATVQLASATATLNGAGNTVVTLTFTNINTAVIDQVSVQNGGAPSLADGVYQLTILSANVTGANGQAFDGDDNGTPGGNYQSPIDTSGDAADTAHHFFGLYRLFGDATGNAVVDLDDLQYFRQTFNQVGPESINPLFLAYMDANNNNVVDLTDLAQFRTRVNVSLF